MQDLPAPGTVVAGRYRIDSLLGRGGMGAVFAGEHVLTSRAVAIKWLLPYAAMSAESVQRFVSEAHAMARIDHPNVIAVLDAGVEGQSPFLVMERLRGESLKARIERGRLPVPEALEIMIAACRGVAGAHAEQIVHRDLKPDNIFLCQGKDGSAREPKVLDFGISKLKEESTRAITRTGASLGTPQYMSREQLESPRDADPRFDVYAMGIVLYEALTGVRPYGAESIFQLLRQISEARPTPIRTLAPEVSPELEALVMRAMHPQASGRHANMRELLLELEAQRRHPATTVPMPQAARPLPPTRSVSAPTERLPRVVRKSRAPWAILAIVLSLAAVTMIALAALIGTDARLWQTVRTDRVVPRSRPPAISLPFARDPLEPVVELVFEGDCHPRFQAPLTVSTNQGSILSINATQHGELTGSLFFSQGEHRLGGTLVLDQATFAANHSTVQVANDRTSGGWVNWHPGPARAGVEPVRGSITFRQWEPEGGILDATFNDVTLQNWQTGTLCHVQGRVQTFGLRWGEAATP